MSSTTLACSGLVLSYWLCWSLGKKKVVVLILLSQHLSLLSVPVCSASGTLCSVVLVFSSQLGCHCTVSWSCTEQTLWWLLPSQTRKPKALFCCRNRGSLAAESVSHLLMDLPVISIKGGQSWLMTSYCKHTFDWYDKRWQQLAFTLASQLHLISSD